MKRYSTFLQLIEELSGQNPDAPIFMKASWNQVTPVSRSAFLNMVCKKADALRQTGKRCLGVVCDGGLDCIVSIFASAAAGMQTVLLDAASPDEILQAQIRATDVDLLWLPEDLEGDVEVTLTDGPGQDMAVSSGADPSARLLFFTSGTTAMSKAVILTEQSLLSSAWNGGSMLALSPEDILLCVLPLNHVFGFVCSLLWGLTCGAPVALGRGVRHFAEDFSLFKPTAVSLIPLLLDYVLRQNAFNEELRTVLIGAGDCAPALLSSVCSRGIHVSFGYGLTETSSGVAISTGGDPYALDVCPDDTVTIAPDGEILISAPTCIMQGYYKSPQDTAAVLKDGVLYTGDLGRLDEDGRLHITGRKKDMIVLPDGTKIFLPEYEAQIAEVLGIRDFAVIELQKAPVLVTTGSISQKPQLQEALRPVMALRPRGQQLRDIIFIRGKIPRTATGKVKRQELAEQAARILNGQS